jgi:hypothetical protein
MGEYNQDRPWNKQTFTLMASIKRLSPVAGSYKRRETKRSAPLFSLSEEERYLPVHPL